MLPIEKVDHVGIRVGSKSRSVSFYELLGFRLITDTGFDQGHPVIMQHDSGVVLNLLGPADEQSDTNILMDIDQKHAGITHVSFKIASMPETKAFLKANGIEPSGQFSFKGMHAIFIRDPDRNVIELDAYEGDEPATRSGDNSADLKGYDDHL